MLAFVKSDEACKVYPFPETMAPFSIPGGKPVIDALSLFPTSPVMIEFPLLVMAPVVVKTAKPAAAPKSGGVIMGKTGNTVIRIALEVLLNLPDVTFLRNQVVRVKAPGE